MLKVGPHKCTGLHSEFPVARVLHSVLWGRNEVKRLSPHYSLVFPLSVCLECVSSAATPKLVLVLLIKLVLLVLGSSY